MRKLFFSILALVLLSACESVSSDPNPYKSNRSFSNIDKVTYTKSRKKSRDNLDRDSANEKNYSLNNFYDESKENESQDSNNLLDDGQKYTGIFKVGNPYEIEGVSYFPQNYEEYEETGTASWYGADFHGKATANGEIYDSFTMTAAHRTLPMPSMVRVTNLRNNKSAIVRVNDRGPFARNRIIDLSEKAAEELGFKDKGTTDVHIQLLRNETDQLLEKLKIKN
ncbi:MAG: septal ring lytic transglycosylase RlpA family protein [Proteobacteria bacterium]|nr:septal ring lytic transglycosylase RlpA family protein [Pseudomonadota bacterium]